MPNGFANVPDWFAWENAGGNIAVGEVNGDGRQDLVVLMVDDPPGKNRGLYRVGKNLDPSGTPTAGWDPGSTFQIGFPSKIRGPDWRCGI